MKNQAEQIEDYIMQQRLTSQQNQEQDYQRKQDQAKWLIGEIEKDLKEHARQTKQDQGNWGYNGDLGHVNEQLAEILRFINNED